VSRTAERFVTRPQARAGGEITVPGDKSISHRALLLGAVADGPTVVRGFLRSDDCLATLGALRALGVAIEEEPRSGCLTVHGKGMGGLRAPSRALDLGNSGTALRLLAGVLAAQPFECELTGDESLRTRPMERVAEPLREMGAVITTRAGRAPLRITGTSTLKAIDYTQPVASAQVKSAVLLAGLWAAGRTIVRSPAPSRDHTERMLLGMGARIESSPDGLEVRLDGPASLRGLDFDVPGDFSSAAFFMVAGCLAASDDGLVIRNVGVNPTRLGFLTALTAMGGRIELGDARLCGAEPVADIYVRPSRLQGIDVPPGLVPLAIDEFPILFVAAAAAHGRTTVRGAAELRHKESDRLRVMATGLRKLGIELRELDDGLVIEGGRLGGGEVDSCGDHRVAMAFAVAGAVAEAPITILNTVQVATSFPDFLVTAQRAGLRVDGSAA
jgi:3-phosphoshikimate 1-carboxyvinyltransferase